MDGGILNSERGLVERIAACHPHRCMVSAALGAGILPQFSACICEMRILGSRPAVGVATCKTRNFGRKSCRIRDFRMFRRMFLVAQREKSDRDALTLLSFFKARYLLQLLLR